MRKIQGFLRSVPGLIAITALLLALVLYFSAAYQARQELGMQPLVTSANPTEIPPTPVPTLIPVDVAHISITLERFGWWDRCMPYFAPDGDRYLCIETGKASVVSLSRGLERPIDEEPFMPLYTFRVPKWAPDGKHVAVVPGSYKPGMAPYKADMEMPILLVDTETGHVVQDWATDLERDVNFTATGELIFFRGGRLHLLNLATKAERVFSIEDFNLEDFFNVRVSPDGQKVAVVDRGVISIFDLDTRQVLSAVSGASIKAASWLSMAWSSDSRKLAYAISTTGTWGEGGGIPELWVMNADDGDPQRIWVENYATGPYKSLEWLPGRTAILFIRHNGNGYEWDSYHLISGDGGPPKDLFINGAGLFLGGNRFSFSREFADNLNDTGIWVATLLY